MNTLKDKVILITGALGQLGQASVKMFLERGAIVVANDISGLETADEIQKMLHEYGEDRVIFIQSDVSKEPQVQELAAAIEQKYKRLDGYLHNAYTAISNPVTEQTIEEWESVMSGTLTSTFLVCKHMLPVMIESGGGAIVNTSSIISQVPATANAAYGAAKSGVNQFTRIVAHDYAKQKIRANAILPGFFRSGLSEVSEELQKLFYDNCLLERSAKAEEVAEMAAFLLSEASSYVTGALIPVDGGYHMKNE